MYQSEPFSGFLLFCMGEPSARTRPLCGMSLAGTVLLLKKKKKMAGTPYFITYVVSISPCHLSTHFSVFLYELVQYIMSTYMKHLAS